MATLKRRCAMARRFFARMSWSVLWALMWIVFAVGAAPRATAGDPAREVAARMAAGEFGPAIEAANAAQDAALRDNLLGNVALKQAKTGARRAALETAGE